MLQLLQRVFDGGFEQTQLVMEHTGFKGIKLMVVSLIMGYGWRKVLRRLSAVLESQASVAKPIGSELVQGQKIRESGRLSEPSLRLPFSLVS